METFNEFARKLEKQAEKAFRDAPSVIEGIPAISFHPADTPTPASVNRGLITEGQAADSPGNC